MSAAVAFVLDSDGGFLSDFPQIWNVGHTCDSEHQILFCVFCQKRHTMILRIFASLKFVQDYGLGEFKEICK